MQMDTSGHVAESQEPMEVDITAHVADSGEPMDVDPPKDQEEPVEVDPPPAWLPWNTYTMPGLPY